MKKYLIGLMLICSPVFGEELFEEFHYVGEAWIYSNNNYFLIKSDDHYFIGPSQFVHHPNCPCEGNYETIIH